MRFAPFSLAAIVLLALGISGCGSSSSPPTPLPTPKLQTLPIGKAFVVTLVTDVGGLQGTSFDTLAWQAIQQVAKTSGTTAKVLVSKKESDYLPNLQSAAQHYSALTIGIGFSMARAMYTAAQRFPAARFALIDARPIDATNTQADMRNVENVLFKEEDAGYGVGVIAGLMEKDRVGKATHNTIGYLGGSSIPQVDHYLAGYVAGARKVDPSVTIVGHYAGTFTNSLLGQTIGNSQIAQHADILFQVAAETGAGYLSAAQKHGVYGIGVDTNQNYLGSFVITSAVKRVDVAVRDIVSALIAHPKDFTGGDRLFGAAQAASGFSPPAAIVPSAIVSQASSLEAQVAAGKITPPTSVPAR